jgi:radical SAM superfamily enzyme YgiQ (UPF0313 family)
MPSMKILLVQPDAARELIGWGDLGAIAEPLALEYLAAGLVGDAHQVRLLDLRLHPGALHSELLDFHPDLVGVTGYSMHVLRNLEICREVKAALPDCFTAVGGHHATLLPEDFFEEEVDFVVTGEGVRPLRAIVEALERSGRAAGIAGVWTRVDGCSFRHGGEPPPFDLGELPFPDRTLAPRDRASYYIDWMRPIALMRSTVGCPYRCNFCSLWRIMDGHYHKRDLTSVVDELAALPEDFVFFVDDEAFVNKRHMLALAQAIRDAAVRKKYFSYCRIDTLIRHRDMLEVWHELGLERLFIGIEAITDRELTSYNKRLELAQVEEGLRAAREIGIKVFAGFIVNPSFEERDFRRLVRFIEHNRVDYPSFTILTPLPGTPALASFDAVTERQPNGRPNWNMFDLQHAVTETRLPKDKFLREYHGLQRTFAPTFCEHRDVRPLITLKREPVRAL